MTRSQRYKLQYIAAITAAFVIAGIAVWAVRADLLLVFGVGLLFLIPGRLSGYLWRDLYRGRRLIEMGDIEGGLEASRRFISLLSNRPGLRGLWWLTWGVYTRNAEAMALNNIGFAHLKLGQHDLAESAFQEAVAADPDYPIPHANLAALSTLRGETAEAAAHARTAIDLGYSRDAIDRLIHAVGATFAKIEGRGPGAGDVNTEN